MRNIFAIHTAIYGKYSTDRLQEEYNYNRYMYCASGNTGYRMVCNTCAYLLKSRGISRDRVYSKDKYFK